MSKVVRSSDRRKNPEGQAERKPKDHRFSNHDKQYCLDCGEYRTEENEGGVCTPPAPGKKHLHPDDEVAPKE